MPDSDLNFATDSQWCYGQQVMSFIDVSFVRVLYGHDAEGNLSRFYGMKNVSQSSARLHPDTLSEVFFACLVTVAALLALEGNSHC